MAVTIIDEKPSPKVTKQTTCGKCGVTLEYTPNDVREDWRTDYTGGKDCYRIVDCPKCQNSITVGI